jgi:anaerobic selenocysteine-containing dehydrogenase
MKKVVHAACPHDCPDACGVLITVEDGRATKIQGDPEHPVTRGFLCAKVAKYLDRVYSPDRVLYPMRRVAPKGPVPGQRSFAPPGQPGAAVPTPTACTQTISSQTVSPQTIPSQTIPSPVWERISWDEALDEIASRFRAISGEFGSEAILPYSFGGTLGALNSAGWAHRYWIVPSVLRRVRLAWNRFWA